MKNKDTGSLIKETFGNDINVDYDSKIGFYNELNWDAKLFFEDKIIRETTCPMDMNAKTSKNNLEIYEEQINDLYEKNLLFMIEILYKYGSQSFVIYNSNHYLDEDIPFLKYLCIEVQETDKIFDGDLCILMKNEHPIFLGMYINNDYHTSSDKRPLYALMCDDEEELILIPNIYYLRTDLKNIKEYTNIKFHFNESGFLEFSDDYIDYVDKFFVLEIKG